jgi:PKD repeat protein
VEISSDAFAAAWTYAVSDAGDTITLTSYGGITTVGENITVTFTGAGGNPWLPGTTDIYGDLLLPLTVTRTDTGETATINFMIETPTPPPGGLTITDGVKISTVDGATSPVITIADYEIPEGGTITIQVPDLYLFVASGAFTDANVEVSSDAAAATWTRTVSGAGDLITLTSTGGSTIIGENVTLTFTGAGGNPWYPDTSFMFGDMVLPLTVTRIDTFQTASLNFMIETTPPLGGISIVDGGKIITPLGATSPEITITDTDIAQDGTITIDVSGLNVYTANGILTDANIEISDTAVNANWTGAVAGDPLTLTLMSADGVTVVGENVTVTFTGAGGNPWISNTQGEQYVLLTAVRTDGLGAGTFNFVIETTPPPGFAVAANFTASPTAELAPLTVTFNDTSTGNATSWIWDFGDGSNENATMQNPVHSYTDIGTYTVSLAATNAYSSDTKTRWNYIHVLNGGFRQANTTINGLTIFNCGGPQIVIADVSILPAALIPNNSVLEIQPPADRGFKRITIYALDGVGFSQNENLISGKPTSVYLVTEDLYPPSGFSSNTGINASFNFSIELPSYPCNAALNAKIWEGVIPAVDNNFRRIADGNNASVVGSAYTTEITKTNSRQMHKLNSA